MGVRWEGRGRGPFLQDLREGERTYQGRHGAPPLRRAATVRYQRVSEIRRHLGRADAGARSGRSVPEKPSACAAALDHARSLPRSPGDEERGRRLEGRPGRDGLLVPPAAAPTRVERASGEKIPPRAPPRRL